MSSKTGLDGRRIGANIIFSSISFVLNILISFFVTPYITANLGAEAYGFVKLALDFTNYASLISLALNSMASRFIMLNRENGQIEEAKSYYTSVTIVNIVLSLVMLVPSTIIILMLDNLLEIPALLVFEVKLTFVWTFLNFLLCLACTTFGNAFYLTNRLDISQRLNAIASIIRIVSILALFFFDEPRISYVAVGSLISSLFFIPCNVYYHKRLAPDLKFETRLYNKGKVWELFVSGIWNSISKLSQILTSGLDLLVTNTMLGALNMGYLSVAKTVPNMIISYNAVIANAFGPNMMQLYAQKDMVRLKEAIKTSMKCMCIFVTIPNAILITMGSEFYSLWVPEQPASFINILSVLTVINTCILGPTQPLYQVFMMTNRIKESSLVSIIHGFCSIIVTMIILRITDLGVFAVVGVSMIGSVIVALGYHIPFSAKYMGMPWYTFYSAILKGVISLVIQCGVGLAINSLVPLESSWLFWFCGACMSALIGLVLNVLLIFTQTERKQFWGYVINKISYKK